jgi:hypothetical protein
MSTRSQLLRRILLYALAGLVLLTGLMYAGDYVSIRYKIPHNRAQFGSVTVNRLYVIHEKNNKLEYQLAPPEDETCVYSLFPQLGYLPCWYVSRHTEQRIEI